jgi:DNA-binding response OmpR family regulator
MIAARVADAVISVRRKKPPWRGRVCRRGRDRRARSLKILFMTGYTENAAINGGFLEPGMELLTKPFAIDALAQKLSAMIEHG